MKHCPTCKTNYADDTLQYCLEDGTPLVGLHDSQAPTVALSEAEAATVVRGGDPAQTRAAVPPTEVWQEPQSQVTQIPPAQQFQFQAPPQSPPKKSNTALAVGATALVMLLLFGGIFGAWLLFQGTGTDKAKNKIDVNIYTPNASPTVSPGGTVTPSPTPSGTITPTINPTPSFDAAEVKSEVSARMNAWKSSMESGSLDAVMGHYASRLDYYYRSGGTSSAAVRNNKKRAFELYYSFRVTMANMNISPNETGDKATVTFTKSWDFQGSDDRSKGSVRAQFQVSKIGGSWYITGEKDL
jgi:hypothetical protein